MRRGDIIGLVGNTGNAVTTPPHLHFGIYAGGGAVDPAPFVRPVPGSPAAPATASVESLGGWGRIITARTAVREGPSPAAAQVSSAPRNTPVQVNGAVERWVRVQLPDATEGFLPLASLTLAPPPLRSVEVTADTALRTRPDADAPMRGVVPPPARLSVLGTFDEHVLVETDSGQRGWTRL